jgi:hypothetical protein
MCLNHEELAKLVGRAYWKRRSSSDARLNIWVKTSAGRSRAVAIGGMLAVVGAVGEARGRSGRC